MSIEFREGDVSQSSGVGQGVILSVREIERKAVQREGLSLEVLARRDISQALPSWLICQLLAMAHSIA